MDDLAAALADVLGASGVTDVVRLSGGASRETFRFLADGRPLILQRQRSGDIRDMGMEANVLRAVAGTGVPVAELVAASSDPSAIGSAFMVLSAVDGETIARKILRDPEFAGAREALPAQLGHALARLHRADATPKPVDPAPAPAPAAGADDDLAKILDMSPQDLEKMIRQAAQTRLTGERNQVAAEIRDAVLFDPDQKEPAIKLLDEKPLDTQKDNIKRICAAFAKVDDRFGAAYKLYTDGKYEKAAEAFKKIVNIKEVSYLSAARSYLLCDSLARMGLAKLADPKVVASDTENKIARKQVWEAVDGYKDLIEAMPDRLSFTASTALNCADAYDQLGRCIYAAEYYAFCVKNFAMTLDKADLDRIQAKVEKMQEIYKDPMASAARIMGDVKKRLDEGDSGKDTRLAEQQIVSILDDLIKTAQEKQPPSGGNPDTKPPTDGPKTDPTKEPGQPQRNPGDKRFTGKPAINSTPGGGPTVRPSRLPALHEGRDDPRLDLPKAQRDKLMEIRGKVLSERYRAQIEAYFEAQSSDGRNR